MRFHDRAHAGRLLAERLRHHAGRPAIVLALPRGGVPVGFEVARRLGAPLDVFVVRKLGVPGHEELARGADEVGCLRTPEPFYAVGLWYEDFSETSDDEVRRLLEQARAWTRPAEAV